MNERRMPLTRRTFLQYAGITAAAAACAPATVAAPSSAPVPTAGTVPAGAASAAPSSTAIGPAEKTKLAVGIRLPSLNSQAPVLIARDKGYFKDAGFSIVELVISQEQSAGITSGSLDFGLLPPGDVAAAAMKGVPQRIIGAFRNYTTISIAVRPEIASAKELDGKDVLLGGVPGTKDFDRRVKLLKAAGWDLTTVKPNYVTVAGGSDAWVKLFLDKKLFMTPIFTRHRKPIAESGSKLLVDTDVYGNDVWTTTQSFVDKNPNTTAQFLVAYLKGLQIWKDLAQKDYVMAVGEKAGIKITQEVIDAYESDVYNYHAKGSVFDGGYTLDELRQYLVDFDLKIELKDLILTTQLNRAQRALNFAPRPVL